MAMVLDRVTRRLVELWGTEAEKLELLYGQTAEDRAAMAEWRAECESFAKEIQVARQIEATDTRADRSPALEDTLVRPRLYLVREAA